MLRRALLLAALLVLATALSGCSYQSEFVVVNQTESPIEVRYKVKNYPGTFCPPVAPSSISASDLNPKGNQQWTLVTSSSIQLDEANRTVSVRVSPHEVLLVTIMHHYVSHDDPGDAQKFPIEEINVSGPRGEINLVGEQARRNFSEVSRALYTLTYE